MCVNVAALELLFKAFFEITKNKKLSARKTKLDFKLLIKSVRDDIAIRIPLGFILHGISEG